MTTRNPVHASQITDLSRNPDPRYHKLVVGTAPDSWGVWFPSDEKQIDWETTLDEMAGAGYTFIETGPFGYFPTDPAKLTEEMSRRGLKVIAGTQPGILHKEEAWANTELEMRRNAAVLKAVGAKFLVYLPPLFRSDKTWELTDERVLSPEQWKLYTSNANRLGKILRDEYDITMVVHPHGDSHIETRADIDRFFAGTDPAYVSFCLDTGHIVYGGEDPVNIVRDYPERIGYVHIKAMDPDLVREAHEKDWPFGEAIARGASVTPPAGQPEMKALVDALAGLDREIVVVVEQDLYPVGFDFPLPNAIATREYLAECNLGARAAATTEGS
ncbi:MAG TPA: TIM barrel protein [Dermatophilaceae bacterium]|jgi:inosose dehydratase